MKYFAIRKMISMGLLFSVQLQHIILFYLYLHYTIFSSNASIYIVTLYECKHIAIHIFFSRFLYSPSNQCTNSYTIVDRFILYLFLLLRFITTDNIVITFNDWIIRVNQQSNQNSSLIKYNQYFDQSDIKHYLSLSVAFYFSFVLEYSVKVNYLLIFLLKSTCKSFIS